MLTDAKTVPDGTVLDVDVCVIGAGAAGITIARELAHTRGTVCVLESGGLEIQPRTTALYDGRVEPGHLPAGSTYLSTSRQRFFGGSTNHWVGVCGPLTVVDFAERDWIPHSGWPFGPEELAPYYARAAAVVQIRTFDYDPARLSRPPFVVGDDSGLVTEVRHFSPPTRFAVTYGPELSEARNVQVFLFANAVDLRTDADVRRLDRVEVATLGGPRFVVRARVFVLATGGIENARLLLNAVHDDARGLGNANDLVGRFFMDHVFRLEDPGIVTLQAVPGEMALYETFAPDDFLGHPTWGRFTLTPDEQRRHRLPHHGIGLGIVENPATAGLASAVGAAAAEVAPPRTDARGGVSDAPWYVGTLGIDLEMTPDPENRVHLDTERDELGMRRVALRWKLADADREGAMRFLHVFAQALGRSLKGRANVRLREEFDWSLFQFAAHHMGTTRMHPDPRRGVVDANGRVHGIANLYVAGSSVFPTSGLVNPTFTIVALSLRLADHLRDHLPEGAR
jgi:choline dehydrogenase-like flavoprotein